MNRRFFSVLLLWVGLWQPVFGADQSLLNLDSAGVALQSYDPVAFFTVGGPVKGMEQWQSEFHGAKYRFHSAKNKALFDATPAKYEPQFGGYCAYGVGRGVLVPIKVEAWQIVDGRLLLQKNLSIRDDFNRDPQGNLTQADSHWKRLQGAAEKHRTGSTQR